VVDFPKARELFAKALETPEGLKVQTIHAFCERILSRFPIEAGILPGFEPLDDVEIAELRAEVQTQILKEALADPGGRLDRALRHLTLERADASLDDLFKWMTSNPQKIAEWESCGLDSLLAELKIEHSQDPQDIAASLWGRLDQTSLRAVSAALWSGAANDNRLD